MKTRLTVSLLLLSTLGFSQGMLPPQAASTETIHSSGKPLLIGEKVPESLYLANDTAGHRSVLSYKSALDILVIAFFSVPCVSENPLWPQFRKFTQDYKNWQVAFLAASTEPGEVPMRLPEILAQQKINWPVVHDGQKIAASLLGVTETPEILIVDEYGILRYRGPLSGARPALDNLIGHIDTVKDPEPPMKEGCEL